MARKTIQEFAKEHPHCCFCGGLNTTTTRDEVPPRTMFKDRVWPDGYRFPACQTCNSASRYIDQALALYARMSFADRHTDEEELTPYIHGVANNRPDLLPIVSNRSIDAKKLLRSLGIEKPEGTFAKDYPIARIPEEAMSAFDVFFAKLFSALYYKHTERIVPAGSAIALIKDTNQIYEDPNPFGWLHRLPFDNEPTIQRSGMSLQDQFDYRWTYNPEEDLFGFSFQLRYSIFGIISGPVSDPDDWMDGTIIRTLPSAESRA